MTEWQSRETLPKDATVLRDYIAGLREAAEIVRRKLYSERSLLRISDLDELEKSAFQRGCFISDNLLKDILAMIAELEKP